MKKGLLLVCALLISVLTYVNAQPYQDDFESYTVGDYLAVENPTWFTTWSEDPGSAEDAMISNAQSHSSSKSVKVDGSTDLILKLNDLVAGKYHVNFWFYVPTGFGGYYNLLHDFAGSSSEWGLEVYFSTNGTGYINAGGENAATFNYPKDTWFYIENIVNLDDDEATLYINNVLIHTWQWSLQATGEEGLKKLDAVDLYAGAPTGETPTYYFDDMDFDFEVTALYEDDFESYAVGNYVAVENPTWWTTWSEDPGSAEDALISNAQSHSPSKSVKVDGSTDLILKLGDKLAGQYNLNWWYYVPTGNCGYYNILHDFAGSSSEWALEVYMNTNGTGHISAGGANAATFNYPKDTWFYIENVINLDDDVAELYINNVLVYTWQWSLQASGGDGLKKLDAVDFFAGAEGSEVPLYYFDDVAFQELAVATFPVIEVTPEALTPSVVSGEVDSDVLTIANTGDNDLVYTIAMVYDVAKGYQPAAVQPDSKPVSLTYESAARRDYNPGSYSPLNSRDEVILHYDGDPHYGILFYNWPIQVQIGAMFPSAITLDYAGMGLSSIDVFVQTSIGITQSKVKVFGMGSELEPGSLLHSQSFTADDGWNTINFNNPIPVTGEDLWIVYSFMELDSVYAASTDEGLAPDPNGRWQQIGTGPWQKSSLPYDYNVRGKLTGEPIEQWLFIDQLAGEVEPGGSDEINLTFDASMLLEGTYNATIIIYSNDLANPVLEIPVTLTVTPSPLVPPSNLTAEVDCHDVILNWEAPAQNKAVLEGYNIYRDAILINPDPIVETTYADMLVDPGTYVYTVKAIYDIGMSIESNEAVADVEATDPVNQLEINNVEGETDVYLTWMPPGELPQWIFYDNETISGSIGLTNGGSFDVAALFSADFLAAYDGMYITQIALYPRGGLTTYALKIWAGPSSEVILQQLIDPTIETWNYIELDAPVLIDATQQLYIGYSCINQPAGDYPAGYDSGPMVPGGDMINISGAWQSMHSLSPTYNFNWHIRAYVDWMNQPLNPGKPVQSEPVIYPLNAQLTVNSLPEPISAVFNPQTRSLVGYYVWRNGERINEDPITETSYADLGLANGSYLYCVTANYGTDCESEAVCGETEIIISVGLKELDNALIRIYPNPADDYVNIMTTVQLKSIRMMNYTGQIIFNSQEVNANELVKINTSSFETGIYFIIVETNDGTYSKKVTIQ